MSGLVDKALRPQAAAPMVGFVGSAVWKVVQFFQEVDFLLSVGNQSVATVLQAVFGVGGWIFMALCAVWWLSVVMEKQLSSARPAMWLVIVMASFPSFALGAIVVAKFGNQADVLTGYQREPGGCAGIIDTSRMTTFQGKYAVHLACGPTDSSVDKLRDPRAVFSPPFTIGGGAQAITVRFTPEQQAAMNRYGQMWFHVVLIPEGYDLKQVRTLGDVKRIGTLFDKGGATGTNVLLPERKPTAPQTATPLTSDKASPQTP